jgi:hypothetical protein
VVCAVRGRPFVGRSRASRVFDGHTDGQPIRLSQLKDELGEAKGSRMARIVLDQVGLLEDDTGPAIRLDRSPVRRTSRRLSRRRPGVVGRPSRGRHDRARPRSRSTIYVYFGRVRPHLLAWSTTRGQLREVTEADVVNVLNALSGHQRKGAFTALRSLFRFAKVHRMVFADPMRRVSVGQAPRRAFLPMTDTEIAAVKRVVRTPAQRLVVSLAAVYAARSSDPGADSRRY